MAEKRAARISVFKAVPRPLKSGGQGLKESSRSIRRGSQTFQIGKGS